MLSSGELTDLPSGNVGRAVDVAGVEVWAGGVVVDVAAVAGVTAGFTPPWTSRVNRRTLRLIKEYLALLHPGGGGGVKQGTVVTSATHYEKEVPSETRNTTSRCK